MRESGLDDVEHPFERDQVRVWVRFFGLSLSYKCKSYQCLYCLGDADLPLKEGLHNLGSKYSLQRHFDRGYPFSAPADPVILL